MSAFARRRSFLATILSVLLIQVVVLLNLWAFGITPIEAIASSGERTVAVCGVVVGRFGPCLSRECIDAALVALGIGVPLIWWVCFTMNEREG